MSKPVGVDIWREIIDRVLVEAGERPRVAVGGAFCVRPGTRFINQQQDEEVVLMLRAHPFVNIKWILIAIGMLLFPTLADMIGILGGLPDKYVFVAKLLWYLVTLAYVFEKFLHWYYSVLIITNERIIDIDFVNLIYRVVTYANLNHIEEPTMVTGGFVRSILQFGSVYITTASEKPTIEGIDVPNPAKVIDIISRLSEELEKRREKGE